MRAAFLFLCVGCASSAVGDFPTDEAPTAEMAFLAGRFEFAGSPVKASMHLRSTDGRWVTVAPSHADFLVAVPPGLYTLRKWGSYRPKADELTIEAVAGEAVYVGSFKTMRDDNGEMRVVIRDQLSEVSGVLAQRYGERLPPVTPAMVRSSLDPIYPGRGELVVAIERDQSDQPRGGITIGFGSGGGFGYGVSTR